MAKPNFDAADVQENRFKGGIGYLLVLFIIPLLVSPKSAYARFCANQGALLSVVFALVTIAAWLLSWIPLIGWIVDMIKTVIQIALTLIGIYYAYLACSSGDARELPVIGNIRIIR